jgi:hypothetical protein
MVEVELSLEVVLVVIEELIFVSHLVELAKEANRRASSSSSISSH